MSWFHRQKPPAYDPATQQPAVRKSYCNREMTFGFVDKATGKFQACACANSQRELDALCREYGVASDTLKTIY